MKKLLIVAFLSLCNLAFSQNKGVVSGTVTDKDMNGEPLPFANVFIKGTSIGGITDIDGKYTINVPEGNQIIVFSFIGYQTKEKAIVVKAGQTTTVNQELGANEGVGLDEVKINATVSKEKESALLLEQKKAVSIKTSIGAQELSKKGVSNAEAAVTKAAGVSKQQGAKNVFVRGLGDRYNSTSLNGLPLPSDDPEYKNIALELFSSDIIGSVDVNKTFSSKIYGDVGGANININSKEHTGKQKLQLGYSVGVNSQTLSKKFLTIDGATNWGFISHKESNINNLFIYNFENSYRPNSRSTQVNQGFSLKGGKRFKIGDNSLSIFAIASMSGDYSYTDGVINLITTNKDRVSRKYDFQKYTYNLKHLAMANLKYKFGEGNSIALNSMWIHNNRQSVSDNLGTNADLASNEDDVFLLRRQQMNDNTLLVNQLLGKIKLNDKIKFDGGVSYNITRGSEPDRRTNTLKQQGNNFIATLSSASQNNRFYSSLDEDEIAAKMFLSYDLTSSEEDDEKEGELRVGYNLRYTKRNFESIQFNHDFSIQNLVVDVNNPDLIFNQESIENNIFDLKTSRGDYRRLDAFDPYTYEGQKAIHSGIADVVYTFNEKFSVTGGIRVEKVNQIVFWNTNISKSLDPDMRGKGKIDKLYILPNASLKYSLNEDNIFRVAMSKSYTLPQFKETAPFLYEDINFNSLGNENLIPSDNYNVDVKWERYFEPSEILSLTGFFKYIQNPINRYQKPSAANELSYANTGDQAIVLGAELEFRKNLFTKETEEGNNKLSYGLNASYLYSKQNLDQNVALFTDASTGLQGASPFLVNTDFAYTTKGSFNSTTSIVFSYFSDRIYTLGTNNNYNVIEKGVPTLDLVFKSNVTRNLDVKLAGKNLLNPSYNLTKEALNSSGNLEEVNISTYKRGLDVSLGLTYNF